MAPKYSPIKEEQETVVRWSALKDEVRLFTAQPQLAKKLAKKGLEPFRTHKIRGKIVGWDYRFPYACWKWRYQGSPSKKRTLTPSQISGGFGRRKAKTDPLDKLEPIGEPGA